MCILYRENEWWDIAEERTNRLINLLKNDFKNDYNKIKMIANNCLKDKNEMYTIIDNLKSYIEQIKRDYDNNIQKKKLQLDQQKKNYEGKIILFYSIFNKSLFTILWSVNLIWLWSLHLFLII